jgi:hypothetical protein
LVPKTERSRVVTVDQGLSILTGFILVCAAIAASRSAKAAETAAGAAKDAAEAARRSAKAAEEMFGLEASRVEEEWIERLSDAFPDPTQVTAVLATLPRVFSDRWERLLFSAADRTPTIRPLFTKLFESNQEEWRTAATVLDDPEDEGPEDEGSNE